MKQIIILIVLIAVAQSAVALNIYPVNEKNQAEGNNLVISYPVLRCGVIERPENQEVEFINKGAADEKPSNPRWRNPFSTENSFRCQIIWVEKELPVSER
jgi:hypothetical protein